MSAAEPGQPPITHQRTILTLSRPLQACPYETTAEADPDTVCGLHLGLAFGIADSIGGIIVDDLVRRDPRQAHCLLRCRLEVTDA